MPYRVWAYSSLSVMSYVPSPPPFHLACFLSADHNSLSPVSLHAIFPSPPLAYPDIHLVSSLVKGNSLLKNKKSH